MSSGTEIGERDQIEWNLLDQSTSGENLQSVSAGLYGTNGPDDHPHDGTTSSSFPSWEEPALVEPIPGTSKDDSEPRFNVQACLLSDSDLSNDAVSNPLFQVITVPDTDTSPDQKFNSGISITETDPGECTPAKTTSAGSYDSQMTPSSQWKDIFNMTPGNFASGLKKKHVKLSFNAPKKGISFTQEGSQRKHKTDDAVDKDHIQFKRRLTFDISTDCDPSSASSEGNRGRGTGRGRGRGRGKGRGKRSKPNDTSQ